MARTPKNLSKVSNNATNCKCSAVYLSTVNSFILPSCKLELTCPMPHTTASGNYLFTLRMACFHCVLCVPCICVWCDVCLDMLIGMWHIYMCGWRAEVEFLSSLIDLLVYCGRVSHLTQKMPPRHLLSFWLVFRFYMQPARHPRPVMECCRAVVL